MKSQDGSGKSQKKITLKTLASYGGHARARKLTKAERQAISRMGGLAIAGKPRKKKKKSKKKS